MTKVLPDVSIQFFGFDNEVVQLLIIYLVGNILQTVIIPVLQFFQPNSPCSLVHGHEQ